MKRFCIAALLLAGCVSRPSGYERTPGYEYGACPTNNCCAVPAGIEGAYRVQPTAEAVRAARQALKLTNKQIINYWFESKDGKVIVGVIDNDSIYEAALKWNGKEFETGGMGEMVCTA